MLSLLISPIFCDILEYKNKDENVHRFTLSSIRGDFLERETEKNREKEREKERQRKRDRERERNRVRDSFGISYAAYLLLSLKFNKKPVV